jgi:hypothetical protein
MTNVRFAMQPSALSGFDFRVPAISGFWESRGNQGGLPCKRSTLFASPMRNAKRCGA